MPDNNIIEKDLGPVSAWAIAKANGFDGTEAEWEALQANAAQNGSDAEAFAKGTRNGEAVASDDPAYHNNCAYHHAGTSADADTCTTKAAEATAAAATASAAYNVNLLAPNYSAESTYAVGDHVIYNGGYYECISAISTAEAWTAAHWRQLTVGGESADLKSALTDKTEYYNNNGIYRYDGKIRSGGYRSATNGALVLSEGYYYTDLIPVNTTDILCCSGSHISSMAFIAAYDANKAYIQGYSIRTDSAEAVNRYGLWYLISNVSGTKYVSISSITKPEIFITKQKTVKNAIEEHDNIVYFDEQDYVEEKIETLPGYYYQKYDGARISTGNVNQKVSVSPFFVSPGDIIKVTGYVGSDVVSLIIARNGAVFVEAIYGSVVVNNQYIYTVPNGVNNLGFSVWSGDLHVYRYGKNTVKNACINNEKQIIGLESDIAANTKDIETINKSIVYEGDESFEEYLGDIHTGGYYSASDGSITGVSGYYTDLIPVEVGSYILAKGAGISGMATMAAFDANKNYISGYSVKPSSTAEYNSSYVVTNDNYLVKYLGISSTVKPEITVRRDKIIKDVIDEELFYEDYAFNEEDVKIKNNYYYQRYDGTRQPFNGAKCSDQLFSVKPGDVIKAEGHVGADVVSLISAFNNHLFVEAIYGSAVIDDQYIYTVPSGVNNLKFSVVGGNLHIYRYGKRSVKGTIASNLTFDLQYVNVTPNRTIGGYIDITTGEIEEDFDSIYTEKIEVNEGDVFKVSGSYNEDMAFIGCYDSSKEFISSASVSAESLTIVKDYLFTVPQNVRYIAFSSLLDYVAFNVTKSTGMLRDIYTADIDTYHGFDGHISKRQMNYSGIESGCIVGNKNITQLKDTSCISFVGSTGPSDDEESIHFTTVHYNANSAGGGGYFEFGYDGKQLEIVLYKAGSYRIRYNNGNGWRYLSDRAIGFGTNEGQQLYTGLLIEFDTEEFREFSVEIMGNAYGIITNKTRSLTPLGEPVKPLCIVVGSSITECGPIIGFAQYSWAKFLCLNMGFDFVNNGSGGTGYIADNGNGRYYYSQRIPLDVVPYKPEYAIIEGGINEAITYQSTEEEKNVLFTRVRTCIDQIHEGSPNTKLVIVGKYMPNRTGTTLPDSVIYSENTYTADTSHFVANDIIRAVALEKGVPFIDLMRGQAVAPNGDIVYECEKLLTGTGVGGSPQYDGNQDSYLGDNAHLSWDGAVYFGQWITKPYSLLLKYFN